MSEDKHALIVGISAYRSVNGLPRAVLNDATAIRDVLVDPAYGGYASDSTQILCDGEATGAAFRAALQRLAARCNHRSTAFIYFSGHGGSIVSGAREGQYLLPVDVDARTEDTLAATGISGAAFTALLSTVKAARVVVVLDCCHAGGVGETKAILPFDGMANFKAGLTATDYAAFAPGEGRCIFAASRRDEVSWVLHHDVNSLFTKHLLEGLKGAAASLDGQVRIFDLFEYVAKSVRNEGGKQRPVFKCQTEDNFALTKGRGSLADTPKKDEFDYDVYVSFAEDDIDFVCQKLIPHLEKGGLRVAISGSDAADVGGYPVATMARGIERSKRTVLVVSAAFLRDNYGTLHTTLGLQLGLDKGQFRMIPVTLVRPKELEMPLFLRNLQAVDHAHPYLGGQRALDRIVDAVKQPIPVM